MTDSTRQEPCLDLETPRARKIRRLTELMIDCPACGPPEENFLHPLETWTNEDLDRWLVSHGEGDLNGTKTPPTPAR